MIELANLPDARGHFGPYGGMFVPETLMTALNDLTQEYLKAREDADFQRQLSWLLQEYAGRPTPLYFAERLTRTLGGAKIYLKREDLLHTGAHKINNALGQILLAQRMGEDAHHRRDRRRPAWRGHRHRRRPRGSRMCYLYGRRRYGAPGAQCSPDAFPYGAKVVAGDRRPGDR